MFVSDCVCTGSEDKINIYTISTDFNKTEVLNNLMKETGLNSSIFNIKTVDIIPRNESGKIQYSELEQIEMIDLNNLLELDPYSLSKQEKDKIYAEIFNDLSKHYYSRCSAYKKILDT